METFCINIFGRIVPIYGIMISAGIIIAGAVGYKLVIREGLSEDDFFILSGIVLLFGMFGAKLLYLIINWKEIEWGKILEWNYIQQLLGGGFVFYGGLIGGILGLVLVNQISDINVMNYVKTAIPCLPITHGFGRIGCFFAGCCYGIPYDGPFCVDYQAPTLAPVGISLFPVQLLEAIADFLIAVIIIDLIVKKGQGMFGIYLYLTSYVIIRFLLENFRGDSERGRWLLFSTSQWISLGIGCIIGGFCLFKIYKKRRREKWELHH